jgi:hypothetical protein
MQATKNRHTAYATGATKKAVMCVPPEFSRTTDIEVVEPIQ